MAGDILYYVWGVLLVLGNCAAWFATLLTLPGNWVIVALTGVFAVFYPDASGRGVSWMTVAAVAGIAALGELVEFGAGAAGAAKRGASRRAMILAAAGAAAGSILGVILGTPIPVIGNLVGALGGGGFGAFLGAYVGELWKGKPSGESLSIGEAALIGRLLGTVGKLALGAMMVVIVAFDVFW